MACTASDDAPALTKPLLRGLSHQIAFFAACVASWHLVTQVEHPRNQAACAVYGASLCLLFGISATYHRVPWQSLQARQWMRRLDHAAIYLLIAGSYTPLCMCLDPKAQTLPLLKIVWAGALLGILKNLLWIGAPKPLSALIYVILGCAVIIDYTPFATAVGPQAMQKIALGGICYATGSIVYATRWPNPRPKIFGYHEMFHLLVIVAASFHYSAIYQLMLS
jgi:hemolysin III